MPPGNKEIGGKSYQRRTTGEKELHLLSVDIKLSISQPSFVTVQIMQHGILPFDSLLGNL